VGAVNILPNELNYVLRGWVVGYLLASHPPPSPPARFTGKVVLGPNRRGQGRILGDSPSRSSSLVEVLPTSKGSASVREGWSSGNETASVAAAGPSAFREVGGSRVAKVMRESWLRLPRRV
jgi:hypothetical protein